MLGLHSSMGCVTTFLSIGLAKRSEFGLEGHFYSLNLLGNRFTNSCAAACRRTPIYTITSISAEFIAYDIRRHWLRNLQRILTSGYAGRRAT